MGALNTKTQIKFKVAMHGVLKDQVVVYGSCDDDLKLNIRRRLADKNSGLEIVNETTEVITLEGTEAKADQQTESSDGKDSKNKKRR